MARPSFVASVSGLRIISLMVWGRSSWVQVESDQWKIVNMKSTIDGHTLLFEWENSWVKHVLFKQEKKCHVQHRLHGRTQMVQSVVRNAIIFAYNLKLCFSLV